MRLLLAILIWTATLSGAVAACDLAPCTIANPADQPAPVAPDVEFPEPPQPPSLPAQPSDVPYRPEVIRVGPVDDNFGNRIDGQDPAHE